MTESAPMSESVLVLENLTVIDGTGAPAQAGLSVVVTGEGISAVGSHSSAGLPANRGEEPRQRGLGAPRARRTEEGSSASTNAYE